MEELIQDLSEVLSAPDLIARVVSIGLALLTAAILSRLLELLLPREFRRTSRLVWLHRWLPVIRLALWTVALGFAAYSLLSANPIEALVVAVPLGLGLGLASQDLIRNVIAGVILAVDRDFQVGDVIQIESHEGEVRKIGMRSVALATTSGHIVEIPNVHFLTHASSNVTPNTKDAQVTITLQIPQEIPITQARSIAYNAAAVSRFASPRRPPAVFLDTDLSAPLHARLQIRGFVFDPTYEDHYRSDVLELIRLGLEHATP